jgi:hypothetical protein
MLIPINSGVACVFAFFVLYAIFVARNKYCKRLIGCQFGQKISVWFVNAWSE